MNIDEIVQQLRDERSKLDTAIQGFGRRGGLCCGQTPGKATGKY
jgi:hypothetical protein